MPAHWQQWEKAKREIKQETAAKSSAVDEATSVLRSAQQASKADPNAMRCPACGGMKFKTREKGKLLACRACGMQIEREQSQPVSGPSV